MIHCCLLLRKKSVIVRNESGILKIVVVTMNCHPINDKTRKRRNVIKKNMDTKRKRVNIGIKEVIDERGILLLVDQDNAYFGLHHIIISCRCTTAQDLA